MLNKVYKILSLNDLEDCTKLFTYVFNGEPWNDGWDEKDARECLKDIFNTPKSLGIGLYDEENRLIGFALGYTSRWLNQNHFYLNEFCVRSELQGKGVGSELLTELELLCNRNNISHIYLITAREGQAEAFYTKNNFNVLPRMIIMSKNLEG